MREEPVGTMVVKTDLCSYSEYKIYPGRGIKYAAKDGKVSLFINHKMNSLFRQKIKPVKLTWTLNWRRKNKKGKAEDAGKKRTKKATKVQKAIVGMSLEDIKKKKSQKVEIRAAAKDAVLKEHKDKAKKAGAAKAQVQAPAKGQKVAKAKAPAAPKVKAVTAKGKK